MATIKLRGQGNHGATIEVPDSLFPIQRELFIEEFLVDFDSARAARAVGIRGTNLSRLADTSMREDIKSRYEARFGALGTQAFRLTQELSKLAFSDARDLFDESGSLLPVHSLPDHVAASIASIDVVRRVISSSSGVDEIEYTHKIRLHDKIKAINALQKQLGLIAPDVTIVNNINNSTIPLDKLPTWLKLVIINVIQGAEIPRELETQIINNLSESLNNVIEVTSASVNQQLTRESPESPEPEQDYNDFILLVSAT
jgi:phage terminase small subunit